MKDLPARKCGLSKDGHGDEEENLSRSAEDIGRVAVASVSSVSSIAAVPWVPFQRKETEKIIYLFFLPLILGFRDRNALVSQG